MLKIEEYIDLLSTINIVVDILKVTKPTANSIIKSLEKNNYYKRDYKETEK
ncbi:hypothetical protein N5S92_06760 [Aliarcobacter cryaerophilus]|uniref:hypothetical protein n=1 Tax=Aliarcobacter cryaerophilus TaxID=28198 RepID=UPI0021B3DEFF|nr:hypothetical protein [Aliarcobacter cryaerophilus]MCT7501686.1 hypothetical protein [Aliarcobacter cryaerophilus]